MNILNKLTIKHLTMNKKRTIVTIMGIILSTALMVGIGLLFSSMREYAIKEVIADNGSYHSHIKDVDASKLNIMEKNLNVKTLFYDQGLGFAILPKNSNANKPYLYIDQASDSYLKQLNLTEGRLPKNSSEIVISEHIKSNGGVSYKIGDKLHLDYGKRTGGNLTNDKYTEGEQLINIGSKEYTIVGIVERSVYEDYSACGYSVFTILDNPTGLVNTYLIFNDSTLAHENSEEIYNNLGIVRKNNEGQVFYDIDYNTSLLALNGKSGNNNFDSLIVSQMSVMLALVSIGCIIVIYNAFAISVMERKKQFGLFSSVGATKNQIRKTVFFEAVIVGTIGIVLGILGAFFGIGIVIKVIGYLMIDVFKWGLTLSVYPLYIIVPIVFMIIVVLVSAYLPARSASRVSPIVAIRQNDDIKIKRKKLKTNRLIKKMFGVEGEIALKNMKRNKKKYRITIASLFISIVLFITFSAYILYGITGSTQFFGDYSFDAYATVTNSASSEINTKITEMTKLNDVEDFMKFRNISIPVAKIDSKILDNKFKEIYKTTGYDKTDDIYLISLDDNTYQEYLKKLGITSNTPIILNNYQTIRYEENGRRNYDLSIFNTDKVSLNICDLKSLYTDPDWEAAYKNLDTNKSCTYQLNNIKVTTKTIFGFDYFVNFPYVVIVNNETFNYIYEHYYYSSDNTSAQDFGYTVLFKAKDYAKLDKLGKDINGLNGTQYMNIIDAMKTTNNIILALKILLYGFISLVTLIGVTSVFNTINTSIALRRKEFAMLRSVGLTPRGFNKILYFESIFFGLKSLLYALPFSIAIVYLIYRNMGSLIYSEKFILPWQSIIVSIVGVFIVIIISMLYASKRIKKENILEAIREENI